MVGVDGFMKGFVLQGVFGWCGRTIENDAVLSVLWGAVGASVGDEVTCVWFV